MDWSYVAGFFDGEGHAGLSSDGKGTGRNQVTVSMANTHFETIDAIVRFLQGNGIDARAYVKRVDSRWKPIKVLYISGHEQQERFLACVLPHCITKREAALSVIAHIKSKDWLEPFSEDTLRSALFAYASGQPLRAVEKTHGVSSRTIRKHAPRFGIQMRDRLEAVRETKRKQKESRHFLGNST